MLSLHILRTFKCKCEKRSTTLIWITCNNLMLIRILSPSAEVLWVTWFGCCKREMSQILFGLLLGCLFTIQHLSKIVIWGVGEVISKVMDDIYVWSQTDDRALSAVILRTHWELLQGWYDRSNPGTSGAGDCVHVQLAAPWEHYLVVRIGSNSCWKENKKVKIILGEWREQEEHKVQHVFSFFSEMFFKANEIY